MRGLDTNVLVRYLAQDDPRQSQRANAFIEAECTRDAPGFVSHVVLCELVWVLETCYAQTKPDLLRILERLLRVAQLSVEEPEIVWRALEDYRNGRANFSDHLVGRVNLAAGCAETVTFDRKAGSAPGFRAL